jgi:hypothetical protein
LLCLWALLFPQIAAVAQAGEPWPEGATWQRITEWTPVQGENFFAVEQADSQPAFALTIGDEAEVGWPHAYHVLALGDTIAGTSFVLRATATVHELRDGQGGVLSLMFFDKDNRRIGNAGAYAPPDMPGEVAMHARAVAPQGTHQVRAAMMLHGRGTVRFRDVEWAQQTPAPAPPSGTAPRLTITGVGASGQRMIGFGAEDDGWFYNAQNREQGADDAAIALRERRIDWLAPEWTRMFFWYKDWDPELSGDSFTFDSDNMQSKYRALACYQKLGTRVTGCGVEWGMRDRFDDPARVARSVGALLEHLIVEKGFTCIKDWTFTNEPNYDWTVSGRSFQDFVAIHAALRAEFDRRGLDVQLMGSDDGDNAAWFAACAKDPAYRALVTTMASHAYPQPEWLPFMRQFAAERTGALRAQPETAAMPFVMAEFGLADERMVPPATNPYMREYDYALNGMAAIIDMLHAGTAGVNLWCLQEVYYPGGQTPMELGLWNFGGGWEVRPIYHALACLTRGTEPGAQYRALTVENAPGEGGDIRVAAVGDALFWANRSTQPGVLIAPPQAGLALSDVTAFADGPQLLEDDYAGERLEQADSGEITLPARAFGSARVSWHDSPGSTPERKE